MSKSRTNWQMKVTQRRNGRVVTSFDLYGNTRSDLRAKAAQARRETPFGVENKTTTPRKVVIV